MKKEIKNMTLEEKVVQLLGIWITDLMENDEISLEKCRGKIPYGIGHVCQFGSSNAYSGDKLAKLVYDIQQYVLTETDSKIPVLFHEEVINGVATKGATITPQMLGMACSFNPELVKQNANNAGNLLKKLGGYYALSPMMDIITDARWGRGEEGFGESAYMVSVFADAFIEGLQSSGVGATAKHYAGYGVENQEHDFFINETLIPFEVAVNKSGVKAIMPGYHAFRGIPATCSKELLIESLREHLGFTGVIVSDYGAITNIQDDFGYANSSKECAVLSMKASVDVDLPQGSNYQHLVEAVKSGEIEESYVDKALERVLKLKAELIPEKIELEKNIELDATTDRMDALQSARESIVLLKNDGILPLENKTMKLLVTGPNADSYYAALGDYTWTGIAEFFHGIPGSKQNPNIITLLDGLWNFPNKKFDVDYERGFGWEDCKKEVVENIGGDQREKEANKEPLEKVAYTNFEKALEKAKNCDVIFAAVGENRYLCGEGTYREDVSLPGQQEQYVESLINTGKPVILCVFGGRPMAISELAKKCAAVLYAWYPGEEGGSALAEIIFGKTNPSAKLAVTLPNKANDVPVNLNTKDVVLDFPFGYGLSYTSFTYSNIKMNKKVALDEEYMDISFAIKNNGEQDGAEIAQIYEINDATGEKRLLGFTKTFIKSQETQEINVRLYLDQFGKYIDGEFVILPQTVRLVIGSSNVKNEFEEVVSLEGESVRKERRTKYFLEEIAVN
ncbi:MAG: glycoside hydrolase family 3 N-terminal domain-containing protein [Eubacteriales bacterium]